MSDARYRILRRLGQGGMAEVFEAELVGELGFVRKVAIKRMLANAAADPGAAQRFLDEARIASRLHHANIVAIVDLGLLDELPFQVLELVDGIDADALVLRAGGRLPIEIALAIAGDVAHALDHAHGALDPAGLPLGIVHRDVKPSNVLVSWGGDVKLTDFGIAVARDRIAQTEAGVVAGTLGFIAPEQRTRSQLDGRTDVFALGLTLHALITGESPLRDVTTEMRVLAGEPIALDPSLPAELRALIEHAVAPARGDRPSAAELASAIGSALARRLTRDPRSHLRDFLAELHKPPSRVGALDQLLGIEVVSAGDAGDGVHRYETVALAERSTLAVPPPPPLVEPPPPHRRRLVPIAIAVLAAAILVLVLWQLRSPTSVAPRIADAASPDAASLPDATAPPDAVPVVPADAQMAMADARSVRVTPDANSARSSRDAGAAAPAALGYLQIVGDGSLVGLLVYVDGTFAGSVPNLIQITLGTHRVEVKRRDGSIVLPARVIDLEPFHTRANPLKPAW